MARPFLPYVQPLVIAQTITMTTTITPISVHNLGCLTPRIDNAQLYQKRSEPLCFPTLPIVILESPQTVTVLNGEVLLKTLPNMRINHQDQILCQAIGEEHWMLARIYFGIIQKAIHNPSRENIDEVIRACFDPDRTQQSALIKELLAIPPHKHVTMNGLVDLIGRVRGKSTLSKVKKHLGYTSSTPPNTSKPLPQDEALA